MCDFITLSALPKLILQIDSFFTLHRRTAPRTARRQEQILPLLEQILSVRCHACTAARTAGAASSAPLLGAAFSASPNFAVPCPSAVPSHTRTAGCGHTPRTTCAGRAGPHAPPPRSTCHHGTRVPQTLPAGAAPRARELDTPSWNTFRSGTYAAPPPAVAGAGANSPGGRSARTCAHPTPELPDLEHVHAWTALSRSVYTTAGCKSGPAAPPACETTVQPPHSPIQNRPQTDTPTDARRKPASDSGRPSATRRSQWATTVSWRQSSPARGPSLGSSPQAPAALHIEMTSAGTTCCSLSTQASA
jgi:hypothetical protein